MKRIKFYFASFLAITLVCLLNISCENSKDSAETSKVMVRLTDAPGDYEEVYIEVVDVLMKASTDDNDKSGWVSLGDIGKGTYNLLELTGGHSLLIAEGDVPSGYVGQIRLILGDNNTVKKNGVVYHLDTPSAQQSGLKLKINETLMPGIVYEFMMDFDVDKSIVKAGNSGKFNLHPVINISTSATSGIIRGTINPPLENDLQAMASVQVGETTVSAYTNLEGTFQLYGLPAGTYTVTITPDVASGKAIKTITNVVVTNGMITNIGDIVLDSSPPL
ncbi:DUF4382 domain-containing protein [Flavobacterium sp. NG2]|uniref:DUF4382 domain-containing protein n=1 Tax=Flavobacterium sp. NG2 TaxID=3097547 RepID=UPI002A802E9F|nr:DUF4382 domain-containing protein [Flavobacterium sp. NG2]WPR72384.1 DUF4382 domain-containing protein [Flavobacterium sp. NG2]